jgi:hypothetical protein
MSNPETMMKRYSGRWEKVQKAFEKDQRDLGGRGYSLEGSDWTPDDAKGYGHTKHGLLWKVTHPVGATLGAVHFAVGAPMSALKPKDTGTLVATFKQA